MIDDPILLHDWHAVAQTAEVAGQPMPVRLLDHDLVLWRSGMECTLGMIFVSTGARSFLRGELPNDCLACPYHGWQYDCSGRCARIPAHPDHLPPPRAPTLRCTRQRKNTVSSGFLSAKRAGRSCVSGMGRPFFQQDVRQDPTYSTRTDRAWSRIFWMSGIFPSCMRAIWAIPARAEIGDYEVDTSSGVPGRQGHSRMAAGPRRHGAAGGRCITHFTYCAR